MFLRSKTRRKDGKLQLAAFWQPHLLPSRKGTRWLSEVLYPGALPPNRPGQRVASAPVVHGRSAMCDLLGEDFVIADRASPGRTRYPLGPCSKKWPPAAPARKEGAHAFAVIRPCLSMSSQRFVDPYQALVMTVPGTPPMPRLA
jgi:hypothetical protein